MSTLAGRTIARAEVHYPGTGGWLADVTLERGSIVPPGLATLQLADLALVGTVLPGRGGLDAADMPRAVVAGGAGWNALLSLEGRYTSSVGVRLSTVLRDLAGFAQEPYDAPAEVILAPSYGWTASSSRAPLRVRMVLAELITRGAIPTWRVPPNGRTRFDAWPTGGVADGAGRVLKRNLEAGVRYVGLDTRAAAFLPGASLEGIVIRRAVFLDTGSALSVEAWTS